jgi:hypothetical protein
MKKLWKPALLLAAIAIMVIGTLGSGAWFTYNQTSPVTSLASGTLKIGDAGITNFNLGTISNLAPGDKTGSAVLYIQNTGTTNLAWFGDLVITGNGDLKKAIYIDDAQMEFLGGQWHQPTDHFIVNGVAGSGPDDAWFNTLASHSAFGVNTLDVFDDNNGMGTTPYEFMGALRPGFAYKLTLRFGMAELANDDYQDLSGLDISFKLNATQPTAGAINALHTGLGNPGIVDWLNLQLTNQVY